MKIPLEVGLGAGVGTIQVLLTKYYDRPLITQIPQPWGNLSTLFNLITGGVTLGLAFTGKLDRYPKAKDFLVPYGFAGIFGFIMNTILFYVPSAGFKARTASTSNGVWGPSPYLGAHYGVQNHVARGFGAQSANPGTTIPYNTVCY